MHMGFSHSSVQLYVSLAVLVIFLGLFMLKSDFPLKITVSFLFITVFVALLMGGMWKSYFVVFVLVGGLIIMIMYLSSFSTYFRETSNFFVVVGGAVYFVMEKIFSTTAWSSWIFFDKNTFDFFVSLVFILMICVLASQMVLAGRSLRGM